MPARRHRVNRDIAVGEFAALCASAEFEGTPGSTETELFRANNPLGSDGEARYLDVVPMGRFGTPPEIAAAVGFLLSDDAAFITGHVLRADGGGAIGGA